MLCACIVGSGNVGDSVILSCSWALQTETDGNTRTLRCDARVCRELGPPEALTTTAVLRGTGGDAVCENWD